MAGLRVWLLALTLGLCWAVVDVPRASAATACPHPQVNPPSNYFDGFYQRGRPEWRFIGSSSYIVVQDGALCTGLGGIGNFTNSWVMIAGSGANYDWGQVGFERTSGYAPQTLRWFAQFADDGRLSTRYSTGSVTNQIGVRHAFRVLWSAACNCLEARIDQFVWFRSNFNPKIRWNAQPWSPQFFAETGHLQTDVPGRSATRTQWSAMGAQRLDNGQLMGMPCILSGENQNPSRWGIAAAGCTSFSVWTK